jgi:hypothetical protein
MLARVLWEGMSVAEDIGELIFNFGLGPVAAVFPQSLGRVRTYLGYHADMETRFQGPADI